MIESKNDQEDNLEDNGKLKGAGVHENTCGDIKDICSNIEDTCGKLET